ncbi:SDR family oxidoreductase [Bradyrhizobium sp. SZCCHNS3052]|uniref:SDR family NAD(P)-dependent oxidoreductase n=1 Tax=Bradyrhizobium sp. SZCCHNS3052 TaxID=3057321 RepID=UPI0029162D0F|nr:SDR family oxidoreductase [Bradyrhizobium sp. SZCCHNS3052]
MTDAVVVSGGASGIGLAVAKHFHQSAHVVVLGRRADRLEKAAEHLNRSGGVPVLPIAVDLTQADQVQRVCDEITHRHKEIRVLVAAAGGNVVLTSPPGSYGPDLSGIARRWTENFASNVLSAVLLIEGLRRHLSAPGGRIILISSIAAYRGSGNGCYGAAKAALHPYCYDLGAELGPKGITVNVVAPGYIAETEFFGDRLSPERREMLIGQTMNRRAGLPSDIASTIGWLASREAGHITGQIVQVNGGAERGR